LHLVRNGKRDHHITAPAAGIFGGGQHGRKVVTRVAGFAFRQVTVVVIKVPDQRTVVERGPIRARAPTADQRASAIAIELFDLLPHKLHGHAICRCDCAAQRVEHMDLELAPGGR
jgi:hypothetical protein